MPTIQTHIDVEHALEVSTILVLQCLYRSDTCVRDHDIETARLLDSLGDQSLDLIKIGDIGSNAPALAADLLYLLDGLIDGGLSSRDVVYNNVEAVPSEAQSDGFANPSGTAGDL